ncbi:MAG: hypothetical protein ACRERY_04675, partial [Pseudomonas sp.]
MSISHVPADTRPANKLVASVEPVGARSARDALAGTYFAEAAAVPYGLPHFPHPCGSQAGSYKGWRLKFVPIFALPIFLSACSLGPDYQRPALNTPAQFKQIEGWKSAVPGDAFARGVWWELYGDAELNALVARLNVSNQNLAAAEAQYRQARA